jgi:hypothetical protein
MSSVFILAEKPKYYLNMWICKISDFRNSKVHFPILVETYIHFTANVLEITKKSMITFKIYQLFLLNSCMASTDQIWRRTSFMASFSCEQLTAARGDIFTSNLVKNKFQNWCAYVFEKKAIQCKIVLWLSKIHAEKFCKQKRVGWALPEKSLISSTWLFATALISDMRSFV